MQLCLRQLQCEGLSDLFCRMGSALFVPQNRKLFFAGITLTQADRDAIIKDKLWKKIEKWEELS